MTAQLIHPATGMAEGPLGIYFLERDPADPTQAKLVMDRQAQAAQGDLYALSVRPYMTLDSLTLLSSSPAPGGFTDYTLRFTHPYGLPADFNPPATASKRLDLFIFDVNLVAMIPGDRLFFNASIKTNTTQVGTVSGYRMVGPLLDLSRFGLTEGTNVFPFRLFHRIDAGNPAGNYGTDGWIQNEYLNATGYDVIPQGATADATIRLANSLGASVPLVMLAKYMDPRAGDDAPTKRANRLPNADPANLRYFLPEAAGDLQNIRVTVEGSVRDNSSDAEALVTIEILDWDNDADVATSFPNQFLLNQISELSRPAQIEASFPDLRLNGTYSSSGLSQPTGVINEYISAALPIYNSDNTFVAPPGGTTVPGLIRVRDTQDSTSPAQILLDESLAVQPVPPGYEPSTRFQLAWVPCTTGRTPPNITAVTPESGLSQALVEFDVVNTGGPITSFVWGFGGGATPNTSTDAKPTVRLGAHGEYTCLVRASNEFGSQDFYFTLEVQKAVPVITDVTLSTNFALRNCTFTPVNAGEAADTWTWDFGGGATPNTSTAAAPVVRLAKPGTYTGRVSAMNQGGSSDEYVFEYTTTTKKIGLRIQVIKNGATYPRVLQGMPDWSQTSFNNWIQTWFNVPFRDAGVEIDLAQIEIVEVNNPTLFNIDSNNEANQAFNLVLSQNPNKINTLVVNSCPLAPGLGGIMTDTSSGCNINNANRGAWIIAFNADFDRVVLPHEIGHILNLPHVRTSTNPINSNNYNLMSYGTLSNALSASAVREEQASCITYFGTPPVNQFQVSNDWTHTYM